MSAACGVVTLGEGLVKPVGWSSYVRMPAADAVATARGGGRMVPARGEEPAQPGYTSGYRARQRDTLRKKKWAARRMGWQGRRQAVKRGDQAMVPARPCKELVWRHMPASAR